MIVSILTKKHWIIFIAFLVILMGAHVVIEFIADIFNFGWFDKSKKVTEFILTMPVYLSYPLLVGEELDKKLEGDSKFKRPTRHQLTILTVIFFGVYILRLTTVEPESASNYVLWIINLICGLTLFSFPARQLKSIELKRNAGIWEYIPLVFQFLCWPLGLWWIQPRLNQIATKEPKHY